MIHLRARAGGARPMLWWVLLPMLAALVGLAATVVTAHRIAVSDRTNEIERDLGVVSGALGSRLNRLGGLVGGAAAHFSQSAHDPASVSDEDLTAFLDAMGADVHQLRQPQGISYIARVYRDDVDAFVQRRRLSLPDFTVDLDPTRVYHAIVWAQSGSADELGTGADHDPYRSTALSEAQQRGEVRVTAAVTIPGTSTPAVEVISPVTHVREGVALGWITTRVALEDLIPDRGLTWPDRLHVTDNGASVIGSPAAAGALLRSTSIQVLGRTWTISTSAPAPGLDLSTLISGLSLSLLVATVIALGQRARQRLASDVVDVRRSRDRYASFLDGMIANLDVGVIACDETGRITVANAAARRMVDDQADPPAPGTAVADLHLIDADGTAHDPADLPLFRALRGDEQRDVEYEVAVGGRRRTHLVNAQRILEETGALVGAVCIIHDISDRKADESRMTQLAMHDHLTGLANRRRLVLELENALAVQRAGGPVSTVLFMDLDQFKQVNDTNGHQRGDQMLADIAERLRAIAHDGDVAARMGGDEFVLLCPHQVDVAASHRLADRVTEALEPALVVDRDLGASSGVSIGVVRPEDHDSVEDVLRCADLAMYEAKRQPSDSVRLYEPSLGDQAAERSATETALRRAVAQRHLSVAYQPITDARTGRVIGVEALVRWDRDGAMQLPGRFLPVAEDTGLIVDVDMLVLDMAVAAVAARAPDLGVGVGVNLSARTLALPDLVDRVAQVLRDHHFPADRLVLELTEKSLIAGSATTDRSLAQLSAMGVRLSLDDFGVGYASLNYLRRFPVQSVKIDRSFISDLEKSDEDRAIVSGTIDMARRLGLRTVAEGVETSAQADLLVEFGCDMLQGYLLGRPSSLQDAIRGLTASAEGAPASVA